TADAPGGTLVNATTGSSLVGTGHNATAVDRSGQDWFFSNANSRFDNWGGRPTVMDRLDWIDGWPTVRAGQWTSDTPQPAPVGTWDVGSTFNDGDLDGWVTVGTGAWGLARERDAGGFVRSRSAAPHSLLLVSEEATAADYRAEADLRVRGMGRAGLVVGYEDHRNYVVAWLDPSRHALVVDVVVDGEVVRSASDRLHAGFRFDTWHAVTAEVRGSWATFEVSAAMEGSPLAEVSVEVPERLGKPFPVGVAAQGRGAEADNVGVTALYEPVTAKVPDPTVGALLPEFS